MAGLIDHLRLALPAPLVRHLPDRRRRRHVALRIAEGRIASAARVVGSRDPFVDGALWHSIDELMEAREFDRLPSLAPLADLRPAYDQAIFAALCLLASGGLVAAREALDRIGADERFDGFQRMCARAWSCFLTMERFASDDPGQGAAPDLLQFWDDTAVPDDMRSLIDEWRTLAGSKHLLIHEPTARDFLRKIYGEDAVRTFDLCPHPAIKADYLRLGYLAEHGGLWIDADSHRHGNFERLWPAFAGKTVLWFNTRTGHWLNGFIAAPAGSPLMRRAFEDATHRIQANPEDHPYALAGPGLLTDTVLWMVRSNATGPIENMTTAFVSRNVLRQADTRYKRSGGRWQDLTARREAAQ
ncbi:MAG: hypothetical protein AAGD13_05530 [Pseudomonadota bacterium]